MSHNHGYGSDPNCPSCRVGAFAAGDARPPMPYGQAVRPAAQVTELHPLRCVGWICNRSPSAVLNDMSMTCDQWSSLTRPQKLAKLRQYQTRGVYSNGQWIPYINRVGTLRFGASTFGARPTDAELGAAYKADENDFAEVEAWLDADCLRAAINPNIPHVSAASYQPAPHVKRP